MAQDLQGTASPHPSTSTSPSHLGERGSSRDKPTPPLSHLGGHEGQQQGQADPAPLSPGRP